MQTAKWVLTIAAVLAVPHANANQGDGLVVSSDILPWSRWQARVAVTRPAPLWHSAFGDTDQQGLRPPRGISLMGDYLFTRSLAEDGRTGYFRASSGLVIGPRGEQSMVQPYLGIGYSGLGGRAGGWSFNADFGLMALGSGNAVRFGRSASGQGLDDLVRELRLTPVLLFGASYAF